MLVTLMPSSLIAADQTVRVQVTVLTASNQGHDFNIVNDVFRDELIKLFSYTSYEQADEFLVDLTKSQRQRKSLPGGYELVLTLQNQEKNRVLIQAVIRKENRQYVDAVLSILKPGVVFLGGPKTPEGRDLIIVLETGF